MKVNFVTDVIKPIPFKGFERVQTPNDAYIFEFNYPFDKNKYNCFLELFTLTKDKNGNYKVSKLAEDVDGNTGIPIKSKTQVNLKTRYGFDKQDSFAYRYKLSQKQNPRNYFYAIDSGSILDYSKDGNFDKFNLVTAKNVRPTDGGSMLLLVPDSYNVGWIYDKNGKLLFSKEIQKRAQNSVKTTSNKLGGTLAGIEADVENIKKNGFSRLISTPIFTDDSLSSHSYWNKNCFQMSSALGNIENYESMQKKLFSAGINFVSDGAFINEGLEGIHFRHVLKWGEESPYYHWFKAQTLKDTNLSMGVFSKNKEFISHKLVNSPWNFDAKSEAVKISKNPNYDAKKPTYLQIFDNRLVSDEQKNDTKNLIKAYEKTNTSNKLEISTHDDTITPYSFVIEPNEYLKNVESLNSYNKSAENKIAFDSYEGTRFLSKFKNFDLEDKIEGGFETWDANTDIAKLNFVTSYADIRSLKNLEPFEQAQALEILKSKNCEVQDYAVTAGKYWTKKTADILTLYAAQMISGVNKEEAADKISQLISQNKLPAKLEGKISQQDVERIISKKSQPKDYTNLLLESLMEVPLDSVEFGDDIAAILASPLITKRAKTYAEIGKSRFSRYLDDNKTLKGTEKSTNSRMDGFYSHELLNFAENVIAKIDDKLPSGQKLIEGEQTTSLGTYVLPIIAQEIVKFALVKGLSKNSVDKNGKYDYEALKSTSSSDLGISATSPADEAFSIISKMKHNVGALSSADEEVIAQKIYEQLKDTDANSFALAKAIIKYANSGLDWRIDAAKDIADIDGLRNGSNNFSDSWNGVLEFWERFSDAVLKQNPKAYIAAEITDEHALYDQSGRFSGSDDAVKKFLEQTGMTTLANYSYFFTDLATQFSKDFTTGADIGFDARKTKIFNKLAFENYLNSAPLNSILYSYNFVGNHDKPRILHCMALDMEIFHSNLTDFEHKKLAASILKNKFYDQVTASDIDSINFERVSGKAIAMADALRAGFGKALSNIDAEKRDEIYAALSAAISDLASGNYLGESFSADSFGVKPIDVAIDMVLEQAQKLHGMKLSDADFSTLYNSTFETILKPAMSKALAMNEFLVMLPGNPTLYAGDDIGLTGYEEKSKNVYQQNRSVLHLEWLSESNKGFIKQFSEKMNSTMALRSRPELKALNNGAPFVLALQKDLNSDAAATAILRQSPDGAAAISLFNPSGISTDREHSLEPRHLLLDSISLHSQGDKIGLRAGFEVGTTFKNANPADKSLYKVCENNGNYFIKRFNDETDYQNFLNHGADSFSAHNRIDVFDSSLILYSVKNSTSFCGKKINPSYVASAYHIG